MSTRIRFALTNTNSGEVFWLPKQITAAFQVYENAWGIIAPKLGTTAQKLIKWHKDIVFAAKARGGSGPGKLHVFREPIGIKPKRSKWLQLLKDHGRYVSWFVEKPRAPEAGAPVRRAAEEARWNPIQGRWTLDRPPRAVPPAANRGPDFAELVDRARERERIERQLTRAREQAARAQLVGANVQQQAVFGNNWAELVRNVVPEDNE